VDPQFLDRVRRLRTQNSFHPISMRLAVDLVRREQPMPSASYAFLSALQDGPSWACGEVGVLSIDVRVVRDMDARLGDDDVTGTFTDTPSATTVPNTCRNWGTDHAFYEPSIYRRQQSREDYTRLGMSRSVASDALRADIDQDMADDASRACHGVIVTISIDERELAQTSLWAINTIAGLEGRAYLIETAEELIGEALDQAKTVAPCAATAARTHVERVATAAEQLRET
jgi:hypothetical protein